MSRKRKRRLTKEEIEEIRVWMETSPQHRKPNIRQIAKRYGVNKPSIVKSLGGWKGIKRGRPIPPKRSKFDKMIQETIGQKPIEIEGYTTNIKAEDLNL
jgi:hypothetical protein